MNFIRNRNFRAGPQTSLEALYALKTVINSRKSRFSDGLGGAILSCGVAFAQTSVTGKVVASENGEPVIGASIKVAGTNTGTVTDVDGTSV